MDLGNSANIFEKLRNCENVSVDDMLFLSNINTHSQLLRLMQEACVVREKFSQNNVNLCSLISAKSGKCDQNCKFCGQSSFYNSGCQEYGLVCEEDVLNKARTALSNGASHFCIVTSGGALSDGEFDKVIDYIASIKKDTGLEVDCSLGKLSAKRVKMLKIAGIARYNHNLEASEDFYPNVCTTHTYQDRLNTVKLLKETGIEVCSGGIIGMGETMRQRLELAFALKELDVECVPINILNPRPNTPFEFVKPLEPLEIIKTIALFRLILQKSVIKIAGGREYNLRDLQSLSIMAGANGLIIGGYLTTTGRSSQDDIQMVKDLSFS